ncbi:YlxR family protein [Pseudonocardia thermophila]|jgi:Predicted nucleic-acid-binding protein implicated in transcription termination|uniref:YlxR family protein n=1 Tax=Pseudonocardia thermophila TaxID=1848 RepID=UPI000A05B17E|nr:YlxR family protein [Pseudonocardia thermophila]
MGRRRVTDGKGAALHSAPAHDQAAGPVRTCIGCRSRSPAGVLLRVVVRDGVLTPDPRRRLPGRGAWLHPAPECLARADRRAAFPRALRVAGPLSIDPVRTFLDEQYGARDRPGPGTEESKVDPS